MVARSALELLRESDPAARLAPLPQSRRLALRDAAIARGDDAFGRVQPRRLRVVRLALAVGLVLLATAGIAWAAGALGPLSLFQANPQTDGSPRGGLWDQRVVPASVRNVGSVEIPQVGEVQLWYARSRQGGWCAALQLPSKQWLGTGRDALDGGGTVPGCFPTREMVNRASKTPVYVLDGFDYVETDVDARSVGGSFWRLQYGRVTAAGAVRVADLVSGRSTRVLDGNVFLLPVADPDPTDEHNDLHLVAFDAKGAVVADDCPQCGN